MPFDVNFSYYDTHDIIESLQRNESFSVIPCNATSLSANI